MATQIVLDEVATGDVPALKLGNFFFRPVDNKIAKLEKEAQSAAPIPAAPPAPPAKAPPLPDSAGVLTLLQSKTFAGKGFNTIFRPRSNHPSSLDALVPGNDDNVLELNLTGETISFSDSLGRVPNRGFQDQPDIDLSGIPYVQRVSALENPLTGLDDAKPTDIHFEPGMFMAIPACTNSPVQGTTLCRMASIPHGTTINMQGASPDMTKPIPGKSLSFDKIDITPFRIGAPSSKVPFANQKLSNKADRLPTDLDIFNANKTITQDILKDPSTVLRNAVQGQDIESFFVFDLTSLPTPFIGGGTANIAFLGGTGATVTDAGPGGNANAHAAVAKARFWVEKVRGKLQIQPGQANEQKIQMKSSTGVPGPTFVVPATTGLTAGKSLNVSWTQLQYTQTVLLNFNGLSWPHISVATLGETTEIPVTL
ncbi:hypothetical protein K431DRAFT_285720 [Polychaeton citri CBS 116435]|uniref:Uncharacterized protein n=1 Tax=Polychaeton citri CBS 116435 TaxID=1314669 RepID=A0A9P4Q911_9PEZI|nr:hypothetical protein K431DRAFT_285720 [Polychaeton citri CBS 116435]